MKDIYMLKLRAKTLKADTKKLKYNIKYRKHRNSNSLHKNGDQEVHCLHPLDFFNSFYIKTRKSELKLKLYHS